MKETGLQNGVENKSAAAEQGGREVKLGSSSGPTGTSQHLSPREAAAAAALARFERHLASHNQPSDPSTSRFLPSNTPIPETPMMTVHTKRKQSRRALLVDSDEDSDSWKRLKSDNKYKDDEEEEEEDISFIAATSPPPSQTPATEKDNATTPTDRHHPQAKGVAAMVACPVCSQQVEEATINDHVDLCIWRMSGGGDA